MISHAPSNSPSPRTSAATASATLVLRRRAALSPPSDHGALTSGQLGARAGASTDDLAAVREAAGQAGLTVVAEHAASRRVRVEGPAPTIQAWIAHTPAALTGIVTAILGGSAPQAAPRFVVAAPQAVTASYTPLELATIYAMPDGDGSGQTLSIIELGGGFSQDDLTTYFQQLGLAPPGVKAVGVDGASNAPGDDPGGADGEVMLDIEVAGAIAPKADIVVYFAPNTDAGFLDAVSAAAHADPAPVAISISWGQSEDQWSAPARNAMDEAFADAAAMGVTVIAAAGDSGSSDTRAGAGRHADFPASSPHVLGCGGTSLQASDGRVVSETVWNDGGAGGATGGGVSDVFARPDWQDAVGVPPRADGGSGRGVPDVAAVADPRTGYQVLIDGQSIVVGGTSAVAPLWSGLIARIAQLSNQHIGWAQTALYAGVIADQAAAHLRDITQGNNGAYAAGPGWDACTGLGVPDADTMQAFPVVGGAPGPGPAPPPPAPPTEQGFEYAQLALKRDPDRADGSGEPLVTAWWCEGTCATQIGSSDDQAIHAVALLDRYGAAGWELVGPPEVDAYVGAPDTSVTRPAASASPLLRPGDWIAKRFWLRRHLAAAN